MKLALFDTKPCDIPGFERCTGHIIEDDKLVRLISLPDVIATSHQAFPSNAVLDNIAATNKP